MKKIKFVPLSKIMMLLSLIIFLGAVIAQQLQLNLYLYVTLYILSAFTMVTGWIFAYISAIKDKEHIKEAELAKKDERIKNITALSKAKAFDIFTGIFAMVTVFVAINKMVDYNSIIILGLLNLLLLFLHVYYFIRLSKKM